MVHRGALHNLLDKWLLIQPERQQQGSTVVLVHQTMGHTGWSNVYIQIKWIKNYIMIQRIDEQTFSACCSPRTTWKCKKNPVRKPNRVKCLSVNVSSSDSRNFKVVPSHVRNGVFLQNRAIHFKISYY